MQIQSVKIIRGLLFLFLLGGGLYLAKSFLVPVTFAALLAMLLTPVSIRIEKKGINKAVAALACTLLFLLLIAVVIALLSWQVAGFAQDADKVIAELNKIPGNVQEYIQAHLGIPVSQQQQMIKGQGTGVGARIAAVAGSAFSFIGSSLLVVIYLFLFIYYRTHLEAFILKLVAEGNRERTKKIIVSGSGVAQQYITGLAMMIGLLWVMYGIGFSIIGIRHALLFAVLCGLLEIMPYVGNLAGCSLTAVMAYTQGGSSMALWVLAVYAVVQFTQTYLLEPLVVGARVSINPLCTIMVIIVGEMVWGIPGLMLAIPLLAIVKIICDNIPALQPYGFLIGEVKHRQKKIKVT